MKRKAAPDFWSMYFQTFSAKITCFHYETSKFNLYYSPTIILPYYFPTIILLFSLTLKILFINSGFNLVVVLCILVHKILKLYTLLSPFLLFLINLHKILSNHCIKIKALYFENFQFCSRSSILWRANQWIGFYMIGTSVMKEFKVFLH